jgi:hypothetical protein
MEASSNTIFSLRSDTTLIANYIQQTARSLQNAFAVTTIHSSATYRFETSLPIRFKRKKLVLKSAKQVIL